MKIAGIAAPLALLSQPGRAAASSVASRTALSLACDSRNSQAGLAPATRYTSSRARFAAFVAPSWGSGPGQSDDWDGCLGEAGRAVADLAVGSEAPAGHGAVRAARAGAGVAAVDLGDVSGKVDRDRLEHPGRGPAVSDLAV